MAKQKSSNALKFRHKIKDTFGAFAEHFHIVDYKVLKILKVRHLNAYILEINRMKCK